MFKNKNILFFAPTFFNYEHIIKGKLESLGAKVYLYDDRPSNSTLVKGLIRIKRDLLKTYINKYYDDVLLQLEDTEIDYVFFLKGESITVKSIAKLKSKFGHAKFVLYLWDSIKNNSNRDIFSYFDRILTFDRGDAESHPDLQYRPLFYSDLYRHIGDDKKTVSQYEMLFVGTAHTDRIQIVDKILAYTECPKNQCKIVMFLPSLVLFWFRKLSEKNFRKVKKADIIFKSLGQEELADLLKQSSVVIDVQHSEQTGLTMRTLEVLGAKRKMITTNAEVKECDFYRESNICVVDRHNPVISESFLNSEYQDVDTDVYEKYYIETWLNDCFKEL